MLATLATLASLALLTKNDTIFYQISYISSLDYPYKVSSNSMNLQKGTYKWTL